MMFVPIFRLHENAYLEQNILLITSSLVCYFITF